jgi:hypothetical protein
MSDKCDSISNTIERYARWHKTSTFIDEKLNRCTDDTYSMSNTFKWYEIVGVIRKCLPKNIPRHMKIFICFIYWDYSNELTSEIVDRKDHEFLSMRIAIELTSMNYRRNELEHVRSRQWTLSNAVEYRREIYIVVMWIVDQHWKEVDVFVFEWYLMHFRCIENLLMPLSISECHLWRVHTIDCYSSLQLTHTYI